MPLAWLWGQIGYFSNVALVTSMGESGHVAVEVNTWNTPVGASTIMMQCATFHDTYRQILTGGEFVFNYPTLEIMEGVIRAGWSDKGGAMNEVLAIGLTPMPSKEVNPPRIAECTAHVECRLIWHRPTEVRSQGELVVIAGQVVAASVEAEVEAISRGRILYSEEDFYASCPAEAFKPWPTEQEFREQNS
jgi:flavin reductase (DIM6/NTAB) family NADH-FMN oxidoreductase RutF